MCPTDSSAATTPILVEGDAGSCRLVPYSSLKRGSSGPAPHCRLHPGSRGVCVCDMRAKPPPLFPMGRGEVYPPSPRPHHLKPACLPTAPIRCVPACVPVCRSYLGRTATLMQAPPTRRSVHAKLGEKLDRTLGYRFVTQKRMRRD
ncbi:hypothetical protein BCV69DRAFT_156907 [Microstroma glucosiphilum]|uniref:Uncharacterized protein n=1 Tax=Pseudomicrostroma glucosiphilum TaxID=1684307 RepID=A0A316U993_9BASI|nr:hypothetical protein BCV69DRAFT_156907 [Pseudomicrostroma glucosiphilum]PWN21837.1 hypothetical protein BCV69DRAFT_156907 [Pseudomicrostroma glucosiphilum]